MKSRASEFVGAEPVMTTRNGHVGYRHEMFIETARPEPYRHVFKRLLDIVLIVIAIPAVVPLIGLLALLVALRGGSPFYSQSRIGRGGRIYRIWKLRTMVIDADRTLEAYLDTDPALRAEWDTTQKLKHDPRITPLGRILRKSSIDELPQLWNVLRGEMSLVGPRPMMLDQLKLYDGSAYYRLRPGINGIWQVSQRNDGAFADRVIHDEEYDRTLSLATDLRLLAATVRVVLSGTGH